MGPLELKHDTFAHDRDQSSSRESWKRCAELGLLGHPLPEQFGGAGLDLLGTVHALEAFGLACDDNGLAFALGAQLWSCMMPLLEFGTDEQRDRHLPRLVAGDSIAGHAASEHEAGSDVFAMRARAVRRGDVYVLDGHKAYVTNAPVADLLLVFANVDPEGQRSGISAFLVERAWAGVTIGPPVSKMGMRTATMGEVQLEGCEVPAGCRLGEEGAGLAIFSHGMEFERAFILAPALGAMDRLVRRTLAHVRERRQFGRPIADFQAVSHRVAEMHRALETSRALLHRAASRKDLGQRIAPEAALVKLHVSESWIAVALAALQLHGALGYLSDTEVERDVRDALASRIYSGTSDIQRDIIARYLGA